jgi:hypothetical protein
VNDALDVRVFLEDLGQTLFVCDINLVENWALSAKQLNPVK